MHMTVGRQSLKRWLRGESPEVVLAAVFYGLDVLAALVGAVSVSALAAGAVVCLGAAVSGWRPRLAVLITLVGLTCQLAVGAGFSMYACLVPVMALVSRHHVRLAQLGGSAFFIVATLFAIDGHPRPVLPWLPSVGAWALVFGLAAALGSALGRAREDGEERALALMEAQRRQIAIDLHDNVSHDLSMIVMRIEELRLRGDVTPQDLDTISHAAKRSSRYLRRMMNLLRVGDDHDPVLLELDGTLTACRDELTRRGFGVSLQAEPVPEDMPVAVGDALAKVMREAKNNILRHGDRSQPCSIMFLVTPAHLELVVSNGMAAGARRGSGLGLSGMEERLEGVGGRLDVRESPRLWVVRASVPC